jgi:putative sugar O-methyltransferase|tara:strand:- start:102 stop:1223 length:1122 start_codon:yes stop_codon:yes gene_type:complete
MTNFLSRFYSKIFPDKFAKFYEKIDEKQNIDSELKFLTEKFIISNSYKLVSRFWHILSIKGYKNLLKHGIKKYASTLANDYYTFTDVQDEWIDKAHINIKDFDNIDLKAQLFKKHSHFNYKANIIYNYLCILLFYNLKKTSSFKHLSKLQDKSYLGFDDPSIKIEEFNITTDKLASLLDYEKINKAFSFEKIKTVLEIGAGSGRTSDAIMSINENLNYVICDIIPTMYVSYKRLKAAFPNKKISLLVDIDDNEKLEKNIKANDISFVFPHQLELLNNDLFDIVIAIDCMHEMDKKTSQYYFYLINRLSPNFYLSIWNKTKLPHSKTFFNKSTRLDFDKGDYNFPENWDNHFRESLIFPSNHLSLGFKTKKKDN